jgi:hypothetical protein
LDGTSCFKYIQFPQDLIIPANQSSITLEIQAVDNDSVDGNQAITLTATPLSEQGFSLETGAGSTSLTVLDNDSPSLSVSLENSIISETGTTTATVTRNVVSDQPLEVTLTSSDTGEATVPTTVTIAANQASVSFTVSGVEDNESDGVQTIDISASADGFNAGSKSIDVSDIDVPDLVVSDISTPSGFTKESATITYRIDNKGLTEASGIWVDRVYLSTDKRLSADDKLIAENPFEGTVAVNSGYEKSVSLTLPDKPGKYYLIAATDSNAQVNEGGSTAESNNTTVSVPFEAMATYSATVSTNLEVGIAGKPVNLQGQAISNIDGSLVAFAPVRVVIENDGFRRELKAITDSQGNFQTFFTPLSGEGGVYTINAIHPDNPGEDTVAEDQFTLLGMEFEANRVSHKIVANSTFIGRTTLENLTNFDLSGLSATVEGAPNNWTVKVDVLPDLAGSEESEVYYSIIAPDETIVQDNFNIRISSTEGATAILPVTVNLDRALPNLVANTNLIQRGMLRGEQAFVEIEQNRFAQSPPKIFDLGGVSETNK